MQLTWISQGGDVSLVHIPLDLYSVFLSPILQILVPPSRKGGHSSVGSKLSGLGIDKPLSHSFLNISVTPVECSIFCHTILCDKFFTPFIKSLPKEQAKRVTVSKDTYVGLYVISAGADAASRVVDLTKPLALAGVPIFIITTYFADFILVPSRARRAVVDALLARGFVFSADGRTCQATGGVDEPSQPYSADEPHEPDEHQSRAFATLKNHRVVPYIDPELRLVHCSGRNRQLYGALEYHLSNAKYSNSQPESGWLDTIDTKLYMALVAALASRPKFLSLTLAQDDLPSLLLDKELLDIFGDTLVGPRDSNMIPILLDLAKLPFEATGIVSGVAGRLIEDRSLRENGDLSYLSTARAGAVMLANEQAHRALNLLTPLLAVKERLPR